METKVDSEPSSTLAWHRAFARGADLPPKTFRIGVILATYATGDTGRDIHPGQKRLSADAEISERRLRDHLRVLEESGWIKRVSRGSVAGARDWADEYELRVPTAVDHRTESSVERPVVTRSEPVEPPDVSEQPPDVFDGPPDALQLNSADHLLSTTCSDSPAHADADASGLRAGPDGTSSPPQCQPEPGPDPDDMFMYPALRKVRDEVSGFEGTEEIIAINMLDKGAHPKAVVNKIRADRRGALENFAQSAFGIPA